LSGKCCITRANLVEHVVERVDQISGLIVGFAVHPCCEIVILADIAHRGRQVEDGTGEGFFKPQGDKQAGDGGKEAPDNGEAEAVAQNATQFGDVGDQKQAPDHYAALDDRHIDGISLHCQQRQQARLVVGLRDIGIALQHYPVTE